MSTFPLPPDPYEDLGIDQNANPDDVKRAYRKLVLKHHPDRVKDPNLVEASMIEFQKVQQAYDLLKDPIRRQRYDDERKLSELRKERMVREGNYRYPGYCPETPHLGPGRDRDASLTRKKRIGEESSGAFERKRPSASVKNESGQDVEGQLNWWDRLATNPKRESPRVKTDTGGRNTRKAERTKPQGWENQPRPVTLKTAFEMAAKAREAREKFREKEQARERAIKAERHSSYHPPFVMDSESSCESDAVLVPPRRPTMPLTRRSTPSPQPLPRRPSPRERNSSRPYYGYISEDEDDKYERHHYNAQSYVNTSRQGRTSNQNSQPRRQRSSSVRSNASSANRSLGDGRKSSFNTDYQSPEYGRRRAGSASSYEIRHESPTLPPAPYLRRSSSVVAADKRRPLMGSKLRPTSNRTQTTSITTRNCYLCNKDIQISRKRDWQYHLLNDLQPYQCIEETCSSTETFERLKFLRAHYTQRHPRAPIMLPLNYTCLFCEEELPLAKVKRFKHIGAHLQEHAFSIIARPQSGKQFYSDSSSGGEFGVHPAPHEDDALAESASRSRYSINDSELPSRRERERRPIFNPREPDREREWDRERGRDRDRPERPHTSLPTRPSRTRNQSTEEHMPVAQPPPRPPPRPRFPTRGDIAPSSAR